MNLPRRGCLSPEGIRPGPAPAPRCAPPPPDADVPPESFCRVQAGQIQ